MSFYDGRQFRPVKTEGASQTNSETIFNYRQSGNLLTANYSGGNIEWGSLIGTVDENNNIDMRYHHRNKEGQLMTGICQSVPEIMENGKIRLHETWQWTCADKTRGRSILEEI